TTLVPTGICFRVDTVSVQNPPASPEYCAQFFTAWKVPARGESSPSSFASRPAAITLRFFVWLIGAVASFALQPPATGSNLLQLRLFLTLKERATPIVRSRPSSVHMDSVWFKRTLWETRNTALKNHAEAQFIIAGRREPSERSASY